MNKFTLHFRTCTLMLLTVLHVNSSAHEGHGSKAPWDACEHKALHNTCSFTNGHGDLYKGTCQAFSEALMCVRNTPIIKAEALTPERSDDVNVTKKQIKVTK